MGSARHGKARTPHNKSERLAAWEDQALKLFKELAILPSKGGGADIPIMSSMSGVHSETPSKKKEKKKREEIVLRLNCIL